MAQQVSAWAGAPKPNAHTATVSVENSVPDMPFHPPFPWSSGRHLTSAYDAWISKVFGKGGSQACQGLFIAYKGGQ